MVVGLLTFIVINTLWRLSIVRRRRARRLQVQVD
jgi:hypothetical protein